MYSAIKTKYLPNSQRIKVSCELATKFYAWVNNLDTTANHIHAAQKLIAEMGWTEYNWAFGVCDKNEGYYFVRVHDCTFIKQR